MIFAYEHMAGTLVKREGLAAATASAIWFDMVNPTAEEEDWVEKVIGIDVPTRAEAREIEASNRFYEEPGAVFMTAFVLHNSEDPVPPSGTLTFILASDRLITVRYTEPKSFALFASRAEKGALPCSSGGAVMIGLIETVIQRLADLIERIQDEADKLAHGIFNVKGARRDSSKRLEVLLRSTGKEGDAVARALESASSLDRLLNYFRNYIVNNGADPKVIQRIDTAQKDIQSLNEHTRFLTGRIGFLMEATLGMISTEQNQIIKLFSVMAVMLMPPTLVASIYGMNFKFMPELEWVYGYPMALGLMLISGIVPFIYFKRKGWL